MWRLTPTLLVALGCQDPGSDGAPALAYRHVGTVAVGEHPVSLAVADHDRDGDADLLVPGLVTPTLTVIENRDGALSALAPLSLPGGAISVGAGDLTGDGAVEIVTSMPGADRISAWRVAGDALVSAGSAERDAPGVLATGDVDGDGMDEIALAGAGSVSLLVPDTDGSLRSIATADAPEWVTSISLRDLDRDGSMDVAVTGARPGQLWLARRAGATKVAVGDWPTGLIAADVDGDPELELLGADNLGDAIFVADFEGDTVAIRHFEAPGQPAAIASGDLDRDGDADLAVAAKGADRVDLLLGDGIGTFSHASSLAAGWGPSALALVDLDGDQCLDLVVVNAFSNDVTSYLCEAESGP